MGGSDPPLPEPPGKGGNEDHIPCFYGREGWEDGESPMNSDARTGLPILEHREQKHEVTTP